ncbi:MAG: ATP-dependent DNA helicase RecG [Patescibacteria group bacterium]|jgi:ATP-dependent DNA helicase RecG
MVRTLKSTISSLPGIGVTIQKRLLKLGLRTIQDVLAYYPKRYDDFRTIVSIASLQPGVRSHIKGTINVIENHRSPRRKMMITEALISDETGSVKAVWFNQPFLTKQLNQGDEVFLAGKAEMNEYGFHLTAPTFEKAKAEQTHTARIVPLYSLTENITAKQLRYLIKIVLPVANTIKDWLPDEIVASYHMDPLATAVQHVHFPPDGNALNQARDRLKFNELFLILLRAALNREQLKKEPAPTIPTNEHRIKAFVASLPFTLTDPQKKTAWEVLTDMRKNRPMNRLLEGDVGSGKTIVATLAMINAADSGWQSTLMAPTEILAEQHFNTISRLVKTSGLTIGLLTGSTAKTSHTEHVTKSALRSMLATGKIDIVIGTHALIQDAVQFHKLGLVITDEQHRFGVAQRKKLAKASALKTSVPVETPLTPHLLSMTATPIPRTLALTLYGDLDLSIIDTLPPGRKPIITKIIIPQKRKETYDFIRQEMNSGRQIFVVCPLIDPSDTLGVKSVKQEAERLSQEVFPDASIGILHGKLGPKRKEQVMRQMADGKINILCATAVVEVGIDVPNASVMVIEGAERFGLAQLHQFRGRVGRAEHQSYTFLFTETESQKSIDRLHALVDSTNGFELAEKDLEFRGPGDMYGTKQTGLPPLKIATLADSLIIKQAREAVGSLVQKDPTLDRWPLLKKKAEHFERSLHLE